MLAIRLISAQVTADAWAETYTYDGFENMGSPLRPFRRDARAKEWTPAPGPRANATATTSTECCSCGRHGELALLSVRWTNSVRHRPAGPGSSLKEIFRPAKVKPASGNKLPAPSRRQDFSNSTLSMRLLSTATNTCINFSLSSHLRRRHAVPPTGTCHRQRKKCCPQRPHRNGWSSQ